MKILIDNGHGKETPGKRSPVWPDGSQLYEYEFNRDIARRVYAVLTARGVDCELIVSEICDISLAERTRSRELSAQATVCWYQYMRTRAAVPAGKRGHPSDRPKPTTMRRSFTRKPPAHFPRSGCAKT